MFFFSVDNLKAIEIEKCKKDISELKNQLHSNSKKMVDYNSLRYAAYITIDILQSSKAVYAQLS